MYLKTYKGTQTTAHTRHHRCSAQKQQQPDKYLENSLTFNFSQDPESSTVILCRPFDLIMPLQLHLQFAPVALLSLYTRAIRKMPARQRGINRNNW